MKIMSGPDHGATDPAKAFADWDEAVFHLLYLGEVTLTSEQLSAVLMFASLHGSTNDLYTLLLHCLRPPERLSCSQILEV